MAEIKETIETEEAVKEENNVLKLKKPVMIDGEEVTEIKYDLDKITGNDVQNALQQLTKRKIQVVVPEIDQNYQAMLFSIASDIAFEDVQRFGLKDYIKACGIVRDFFLEE